MSDEAVLSDLRLVLEVARAGSFAAAARLRGDDPSRISRRVASLETGLGFPLFVRTTRRLDVTEAGRLYLDRSAPALAALDDARREARDLVGAPGGTLVVTTSVAFAERRLGPLLAGFLADHPRISLDLRLTDAVLDPLEDGIDVALRLAARLKGDALVASRLTDVRYRVVAAPAYIARAGAIESPADLSTRECLLTALPGYRSRWRFRKTETETETETETGAVEEVPVAGRLGASDPLALRRAALDGAGPALLADWMIDDDVDAGRLIDLLPRHRATATTFDTGVWIVRPSRGYVPAKVRVFIDHLRAAALDRPDLDRPDRIAE